MTLMKMMSLDHDIELRWLLTGKIMYNIWQLQRELQQDGHSTSMWFYEHFKGIIIGLDKQKFIV